MVVYDPPRRFAQAHETIHTCKKRHNSFDVVPSGCLPVWSPNENGEWDTLTAITWYRCQASWRLSRKVKKKTFCLAIVKDQRVCVIGRCTLEWWQISFFKSHYKREHAAKLDELQEQTLLDKVDALYVSVVTTNHSTRPSEEPANSFTRRMCSGGSCCCCEATRTRESYKVSKWQFLMFVMRNCCRVDCWYETWYCKTTEGHKFPFFSLRPLMLPL